MVRNRVLLVLLLAGLLAVPSLAFLTLAPNRLISGAPVGLGAMHHEGALVLLMPGVLLALGVFLPQRAAFHAVTAAAAASFLLLLVRLAGSEAAVLAQTAPPVARISPGGAFWVLLIAAALALSNALRRLAVPVPVGVLLGAAMLGAMILLLLSGALDSLAILREYAARRAAFAAAILRHAAMVALALLPTLLLGVPLGVLARHRAALAAWLFPLLNVVQTIPSIALFGLLLAPLSELAAFFPALARLGIGGVGMLPAVIALILYALLPVTRNTSEGLAGVSPAALEAGRGFGMTPRQLLWRVELPLALPVILSGLRIATLQTIGLAAVAALIGAGGLGAIMFQGLFADALDLVLLGVLPIIAMALAANALFDLGLARLHRMPR
ncbi:MAG TPA: ABC transporter permease [Stellaceae bacterium]|nr:ABC transporter permease [Stellaceae bacterium]